MVTVITWLSTPKAVCEFDIKTKILKVETENTLRLHYLMSKWSIIRIINHLISSKFYIAFNPLNHSKQKWECFTSETSRPLHSSPLPKNETRMLLYELLESLGNQVDGSPSTVFPVCLTKKHMVLPWRIIFSIGERRWVRFPRDASCEMIFKG